jgi:hypothetical protein
MSMKQFESLNLRETGRVLSTRERGRRAAEQVQDVFEKGNVVISFGGVEVATPSFLDEIVLRLGGLLRGNTDRLVVIASTNEDVSESLELVLDKHRMALAKLKEDQIELLGGSAQLKKTLKAAQRLGSFSTPELAKELELKLPNLHHRLKDLLEAGALAREPDQTAKHGKRDRYEAPDAADAAKLVAA